MTVAQPWCGFNLEDGGTRAPPLDPPLDPPLRRAFTTGDAASATRRGVSGDAAEARPLRCERTV